MRQYTQKAGQTVFELVEPIVIAKGTTIELFADYTGDAIVSLDTATTHTANTERDGSGTNRTNRITVDNPELSEFNEIKMTLTFANTGSDDELYVTSLVVTGAVLERGTPLKVSRRNQASIDRYRLKTLPLENTWIAGTAAMQSRADALLTALAVPETRLTLAWHVADWADFKVTGARANLVTVKMPRYEVEAFIEWIGLNINVDGVPVCTLRLTEKV